MPEFGISMHDLTRNQSPKASTQQLNYGLGGTGNNMLKATVAEETSDSEDDLISAFK